MAVTDIRPPLCALQREVRTRVRELRPVRPSHAFQLGTRGDPTISPNLTGLPGAVSPGGSVAKRGQQPPRTAAYNLSDRGGRTSCRADRRTRPGPPRSPPRSARP